jgi:beta-glucosidase
LLKWLNVICRENVLACAKHFVADGGTDKGLNEGNTICSPEDLERIHMKPYPDCITQGVATVMASYSKWNGEPLHGSRYLLTDVLKGKLGFKVVEHVLFDCYLDANSDYGLPKKDY